MGRTGDHWAHAKPLANVTIYQASKPLYCEEKFKPDSHTSVMRTYLLNFYEDQHKQIQVAENQVVLFLSK